MEIIFLENISKLGKLGQTVDVKAGFGRNYLIPQGKAVRATAANTAAFEVRRAELESAAAGLLAADLKALLIMATEQGCHEELNRLLTSARFTDLPETEQQGLTEELLHHITQAQSSRSSVAVPRRFVPGKSH